MLYGNNDRPGTESFGGIFHVMKTDGGRTWSQPANISNDDDPAAVVGQHYGNISAAPTGASRASRSPTGPVCGVSREG